MEKTKIDFFFEAYEINFNNALTGKQTNIEQAVVFSFANCFIESSPVGVICNKNDETFPQKIKQGFDFYKSIGTQSMHILSKEVNDLDQYHSMVKVRWRYTAIKKDSTQVVIDFDVFYFLRAVEDDIKIFAYVTGDEQKSLEENGLLEKQLK